MRVYCALGKQRRRYISDTICLDSRSAQERASRRLHIELFRQEMDIVLVGRGFIPICQQTKLRQHLVREGTRPQEGTLPGTWLCNLTARHGVQLFAFEVTLVEEIWLE